ncbi:MAG: hypothetical protein IKV64_01245, partial [Clostridia bacterium]|nr:hypothetical protein [Clostridia bacterium]
MYNKLSLKAEEFIDNEEILKTLDYAEKNKNNLDLVRSILDKARQRKGLNHTEASVLLACEDEEIINEIYDLAEQVKKDYSDVLFDYAVGIPSTKHSMRERGYNQTVLLGKRVAKLLDIPFRDDILI